MFDRHPEIMLLVLVGFAAYWSGLLVLIGKASGWSRLAGEYRATHRFVGRKWHFRSAAMRFSSHYGHCLTLGVDRDGLSIAVQTVFRPGHPPLFIPWEDISATALPGWLTSRVDLRFRKTDQIPFRISKRLFDQMADEVRSEWPEESAMGAPGNGGAGRSPTLN